MHTLTKIQPNVLIATPKDAAAEHCQTEIAKIAESLGLDVQAKRYTLGANVIPEKFSHVKLSDAEWTIWQAFCPTSYSGKQLNGYTFDVIPPPVLKHWGSLAGLPWDTIEIRTTEKTEFADPILVGTYDNAVYLLARWGEDAPDLISFDEVKDRVTKVLNADEHCTIQVVSLWFVAVFALSMHFSSMPSVAIAVGILGVLVTPLVVKLCNAHARNVHPIGRALKELDKQ